MNSGNNIDNKENQRGLYMVNLGSTPELCV